MTEFCSQSGPIGRVPDDLTIPQFFLDSPDPSVTPKPKRTNPWMIEEHTGREIYLNQLRERTLRLANALFLKWRLVEDDVVCVFSPNHVDYPAAVWAIHRLGAIVTPASPAYTVDELVYQLEASRAKAIISHTSSYDTALKAAQKVGIPPERVIFLQGIDGCPSVIRSRTLESFLSRVQGQKREFEERRLYPGEAKRKVAFLSFSSGTTGKPKAVIIPHISIIANIYQGYPHLRMDDPKVRFYGPGDVGLGALPFYHIYGLVVALHQMPFFGLSLVVVPKFNFEQFLKNIVRFRINCLPLVPPQIVLLCKHPIVKEYDLSHVKYIGVGAAPLSAELTEQISQLLPNARIGQGYSLTEAGSGVSHFPTSQKIGTVGSAGQLLPGVKARVLKPDGSLAKEGETGELLVTSPGIAIGYLNNPQATKETFVDGWVRTGDEVVIQNSEIFILDRIKEIMKVKGFQVAPAELEGHLHSHPAVADVCVVGVPDEYSGEVPMAYVVLSLEYAGRVKGNVTEEEKLKASITKHVADHKVAYKHLNGGVEFIDAIPKNPSGKLLRRVLKERAKVRKATSRHAKL